MAQNPERRYTDPNEDLLIARITGASVDRYKSVLEEVDSDTEVHALRYGTAITGGEILDQLDDLQDMLRRWVKPKDNRGLEVAVRPHKTSSASDTFTVRYKPKDEPLPEGRENAQSQLSLHLNIGQKLTADAALEALSLRHTAPDTLEEYTKLGLGKQTIFVAISTVKVYRDISEARTGIIPQAGIKVSFNPRQDKKPEIHGRTYIGNVPFDTTLKRYLPDEEDFSRMGERIIYLSQGNK